ncbi:MAG: zinc ribbon domain-containing protein, partial [Actinomycetota bacterium]|nr:zinc ribbon domain-containing protein [Actinomycetota bacterium]
GTLTHVNDLRCPNCSALVSADADWCGQCFTSLRTTPDPEPPTASVLAPPEAEGNVQHRSEAIWPCPTCGAQNQIELDICEVCGTSFAQLLREEKPRPTVSPRDAFLWSLTFPGVGHAKAGRVADGIARGSLFGLTSGLALVIIVSGIASGVVIAVLMLLVVTALTLYLGSAIEAYRIADGGEVFVSPRTLLWATVVLIMIAVGLLSMSMLTVNSR